MKRNLYALLLVLCVVVVSTAQVPKMLLIEEFTQASCPPCATFNPTFDALMKANIDNVVVNKYQVWWPGSDPMYDENPEETRTRVNFHPPNPASGGYSAPSIYVGVGNYDAITSMTQARINAFLANETSPVSMNVDHEINAQTGNVDITVAITNESNTAIPGGQYRLQTVIQEEEINFSSPPGTNGEREFNWVMRKMLPNADGTAMNDEIAPGETMTYTFEAPIPWYSRDLGFISIAAWIEDPVNRGYLQAGKSAHKPLNGNFPDLATNYSIVGYDGYCDTEVSANFQIRNAGSEEVTSFDIAVVNPDGSLTVADSWTGNLAVGATESLTMDQLQLSPGANSLNAAIVNINGFPDKNGHNASRDNSVFYALAPDVFAEEVMEGFDITEVGEVPDNMLFEIDGINIVTASMALLTFLNQPLGGFGQSDGAVWIDFPTAGPGNQSAFLFDKVDLSDMENVEMTFNYAYALRGTNGSDRIIIEASSDCGNDWYTIYDVVGSTVTTAPATATSTRFFPTPDQWAASDTFDLSMFDGEDEVIFRFKGISGGAQAFWFDDIRIQGKRTTSSKDIELLSDLVTFPNPASDVVNIGFSLTEAVDLDINVTDLSGKVVDQLGSFSYPSGEHNLQWNPVQNGTYLVNIRSGQEVTTRRVTVVK